MYWCKPARIKAEDWIFTEVSIILFQKKWSEAQCLKNKTCNCPNTYGVEGKIQCVGIWLTFKLMDLFPKLCFLVVLPQRWESVLSWQSTYFSLKQNAGSTHVFVQKPKNHIMCLAHVIWKKQIWWILHRVSQCQQALVDEERPAEAVLSDKDCSD